MNDTISQVINGKEYRFPVLSARQRADKCREVWTRHRDSIIADYKAANLEGQPMLDALAKHREREDDVLFLLDYIKTTKGTYDLVDSSAKLLNGSGPQQSEIDSMNVNDLLLLAAQIAGFSVLSEEERAKQLAEDFGKDRSADPTSAAASGVIG